MLLVGAMLATLAGGCLLSGREQSSRSGGPSPSFGLNYVPQQSEPPLEGTADGPKTSTRINTTANLDTPAGDTSSKPDNKLVNWLVSRDKGQPERKPLPISARAPEATDDEQGER
jgi:hypothetical protein